MKKLYFALLLISPYFLFAQTTINLQDSEDNISGGSYELTTSSSDAVDVPFEIKNTGASDANWRITRLKMDVPGGWSDLMCWGHATDPFGGTCLGKHFLSVFLFRLPLRPEAQFLQPLPLPHPA